MRIVHISDLHFGKHDPSLAKSLLNELRRIQPNLVICTGDIGDSNDRRLFEAAAAYLEQVQSCCSRIDGAPALITVPGNHDARDHGFLFGDRGKTYIASFGTAATDFYFEAHNLWVYGFDSATEGSIGGSGKIRDEDLNRFHDRYDELASQYPGFADAVKVVAVHHHPLPVNWNADAKDRWLTMMNAGSFLSAALYRRVDLILHGHEHLQARARLWSTLGANDHTVTVISLGTTLRAKAAEGNWFGVIDIEKDEVKAYSYSSVGGVGSARFDSEPVAPAFFVRSRHESAERELSKVIRGRGYYYARVSSIAKIGLDGDAQRWVEFHGLHLLDVGIQRAQSHDFKLPRATGSLACFTVSGDQVGVVSESPMVSNYGSGEYLAKLRFDRRLLGTDSVSYTCQWYALNSYALDESQFNYLYGRRAPLDNAEFTYYPVEDPIKELTLVVNLPMGMPPGAQPEALVVVSDESKSPRQLARVPGAEYALREALQYHRALNVITLTVRSPRIGYSYGIRWTVKEVAKAEKTFEDRQVAELRRIWRSRRPSEQQRQQLAKVLVQLILIARESLMGSWDGPVDISFMYFDGNGSLPVLAAAQYEGGAGREIEYRVVLKYGVGIAGRAFKANGFRVYSAPESEADSDEAPDFYVPVEGVPHHQALLAIPISTPGNKTRPYGVLSVGSVRFDCPIGLAGLPEGKAPTGVVTQYQLAAGELLFQEFVKLFLNIPRQDP